MHQSRSRIGRDKFRTSHHPLLFDQRMTVNSALQIGSFALLENFDFPTRRLAHRLNPALGQPHLSPIARFSQHVNHARMHRHRQIGWECPGSRRPNQQILLLRVLELQSHIDRLILPLGILHLCLGQSCSATRAPVNRSQPLIHHSLFYQLSKCPKFRRLVGGTHRQVGLIPIPKHPEPLELLLLPLDEVTGHLLTLAPNDGGVGSDQLLLSHHFVFNR